MSRVDDSHKNASVGTVVDVANRSWSEDGSRLVTMRCAEHPYEDVVLRAHVINWEDAMMLVDRTAVLCGQHIYPLVTVL